MIRSFGNASKRILKEKGVIGEKKRMEKEVIRRAVLSIPLSL